MLTCQEAARLMSKQLERPLGVRERWELRLHLWFCVNCRRCERQLAVLRLGLRQLGQRAAADLHGADLSPAARERIRAALLAQETAQADQDP
jgi:hypothetical protein